MESQEDFLTAYGRIGSTAPHHHIAGLLTMIFKPYAHTLHLVRVEVVYGLLHLLQQFDGWHYKTLEKDINLLLEQTSPEELSIHDLIAACVL